MNFVSLKEISNFLLKPLKSKRPEIYHIKLTRAITSTNANRFITLLRTIKRDQPQVFMLSLNTSVGLMTEAQMMHDALKQTAEELNAPIYTFAEDFALGPGYYLLSLGQRVHANISLSQKEFGFARALSRYHIQYQKIGKEKCLLDSFEMVTQEQKLFQDSQLKLELELMIDQIRKNRSNQLSNFSEEQIKNEILISKGFNAEESLQKGLVDEILTFEQFRQQYFDESKVKQVSVEKDQKQKSLIKGENFLVQQMMRIFKQHNNFDNNAVRDELFNLMMQISSNNESKLIVHDFILDVVNDMICNNFDPLESVIGQIVNND